MANNLNVIDLYSEQLPAQETNQTAFENLSKQELSSVLQECFGKMYRSEIAKELEIAESTLFRIFKRDKISRVYMLAFAKLIKDKIERIAAL